MIKAYKYTTAAGIPQEEFAYIDFLRGKFAVVKRSLTGKGEVLTTHESLPDAETTVHALGYTIPVSISALV